MAKKRSIPKDLCTTLYVYLEPGNKDFAKVEGKALSGSSSMFINNLIAKARGVAPHDTKLDVKRKLRAKEKQAERNERKFLKLRGR